MGLPLREHSLYRARANKTAATNINAPPHKFKAVNRSPNSTHAKTTVTTGSKVESMDASTAPMRLTPSKNAHTATTVPMSANAMLAPQPAKVLGKVNPCQTPYTPYTAAAEVIMMVEDTRMSVPQSTAIDRS